MRITDSLVETLLQRSKHVTKEQLMALHEQKKTDKLPLQDLAVKNNLVSEQELTKLYAAEIDVPYIELNAKEIKPAVLKLLPERIARQYNAVVFDVDQHGVNMLAVEDPDDIQALNFLQKQLGNDVKVHITTTSLLQSALDQYRGNISSELTKVIADESASEESEEVDENDLAARIVIAKVVYESGIPCRCRDGL